ncbi:hypothetical protein BDP67DRAFT_395456, partial [Colletotrichum lupini]
KIEFMRGNINDFLNTLLSYKETILIGLSIITILVTYPTNLLLEEHNEIIINTIYYLNV